MVTEQRGILPVSRDRHKLPTVATGSRTDAGALSPGALVAARPAIAENAEQRIAARPSVRAGAEPICEPKTSAL